MCLLGTIGLSVPCIYIFYQPSSMTHKHTHVCRAFVCSNHDCFFFPGVGGALWEGPCHFAGTHQDGAALPVQPKWPNTCHILRRHHLKGKLASLPPFILCSHFSFCVVLFLFNNITIFFSFLSHGVFFDFLPPFILLPIPYFE